MSRVIKTVKNKVKNRAENVTRSLNL